MSVQTDLDIRISKLREILTGANTALVDKDGTAVGSLSELPAAIQDLSVDSELQYKVVTPTGEYFTVEPDEGYDGLSAVDIEGDENLVPENIAKDITIYGVKGTHEGEDITWQDITVTPEAYEVKVNAPEGFGIKSVTIPAEEDYAAENILLGADLWGLKGTHRAGTQLPAEYMNYLTEAIIVCAVNYMDFMDSAYVKGGHNFFLAENNEYITVGFMPAEGITITKYNPATTEFSSYGWVGYRYNKSTEEWAVQDYRFAESPGGNFGRNIKYASRYIEYNGMTLYPVGITTMAEVSSITWDDANMSANINFVNGDAVPMTWTEDADGNVLTITIDGHTVTSAEVG